MSCSLEMENCDQRRQKVYRCKDGSQDGNEVGRLGYDLDGVYIEMHRVDARDQQDYTESPPRHIPSEALLTFVL